MLHEIDSAENLNDLLGIVEKILQCSRAKRQNILLARILAAFY